MAGTDKKDRVVITGVGVLAANGIVTGVGVLAANGIGREAFWDSLVAGRSGIGPITLFDASDLPCRIAGEVKNFQPEKYLKPEMKARRMGRFTQLGIAAARMAVADSGLDPAYLAGLPELPVVMGVSTSAMDLIGRRASPFTAVHGVPHAVTSAIGYLFHANPTLLTVSDGCASSLDAVATAAALIRDGRADVVLAGGAEGAITHYVIENMLACRRCSTRNDQPEKASRPFDRERDFGVMAEGAGLVVLESEAHARTRGAAPYGEIAAYASCADPAAAPEGGGLAPAMTRALAHAGMRTTAIDFISAHGPSDLEMDRTETAMIKTVFGPQAYRIPVTSIKGATGCPMGAGGVLQLIATALTLRCALIPPTTNYEHADPECDLDYVPGRPRNVVVRAAMINSHGFGRGNGALILRRVT
ncbi:MAG: beta-ketoacyl synthase N-terminal-like domain-containing protein [Kiritimatiellaeota bacterium]|nr:beta-ketoacyl synthase N-terminal-like domain-containing protein [Kiritimatiellota bacterium]